MKVLDIGCGKDWKKWIEAIDNGTVDNVTCVDAGYGSRNYTSHPIDLMNENIFDYLEKLNSRDFNMIYAERVFEHIPYDKLSYLIYLLYECSVEGAELIITVPDYSQIGKSIASFSNDASFDGAKDFNKWLIDIHTETFNEPSDPHRSIWTPELGNYWLTLEGYWRVKSWRKISRDNRDWYIEFRAVSTRKPVDINDIIAPVEGDFNEPK